MNSLVNVKSFYSMRKSVLSIDDIVEMAVVNSFDSIVLCDSNMFGIKEFYDKCLANGIKPVAGLEVPIRYQDQLYTTNIVARNTDGYKKLIEISTNHEFGKEPELNSLLDNDDIYLISGKNGFVESLLSSSSPGSLDILSSSNVLFGFYEGCDANLLSRVSYRNIPAAYFNPVRSFRKGRLEALDLISEDRNISYIDSHDYISPNYKSDASMPYARFTDSIISGCSFEIAKENGLPHFNGMSRKESFHVLLEEVKNNLNRIIHENGLDPKPYEERAKEELKVIQDMGFADYFLIVQDYVNYAKEQGIMVGPGRGSAAGSLVAYALHITDIDPIEYGLFFERFLNKDRVTMPDIDVDFQSDKRREVINYIKDKYGSDNVSRIAAFSVYGPKIALRDVSKELGYSNDVYSTISKYIKDGQSLTDRYASNFQFRTAIDKYPPLVERLECIDLISRMPRQTSTHAAGIVLASDELSHSVPLAKAPNGTVITQYSKDYIESIGLLKMDVLGISDLSTIKDILDRINIGNEDNHHFYSICDFPMDDDSTYELLRSGNTFGVFRLDSPGMKRTLRDIDCSSFDDIVAACALYRPGPMENISVYAERKKGKTPIVYDPPELEDVLKDTYGIFIYQEQIMQCARDLAGFSLSEADTMRKAVSKKNEAQMESMKSKFIDGCMKNGISSTNAENVFNRIEKFANYGFNKAHAVSYARISYGMAYLKEHYPLEFHIGLLNSGKKYDQCLTDCKSNHIEFLNPSVNKSEDRFYSENGKVRFPLSSISGLNKRHCSTIIDEREKNGEYKDIFDFVERTKCDSNVFTKLTYSGALDCFGYNRTTLAQNFSYIKNFSEHSSLFCVGKDDLQLLHYDDDFRKLSNQETNCLGISISTDPVKHYRDEYNKPEGTTRARKISSLSGYGRKTIIGRISYINEFNTKKDNSKMCRLTVQDESDSISATVFPDCYSTNLRNLVKDNIVVINGRYQNNKHGKSIIVDSIEDIERSLSKSKKSATVHKPRYKDRAHEEREMGFDD